MNLKKFERGKLVEKVDFSEKVEDFNISKGQFSTQQ